MYFNIGITDPDLYYKPNSLTIFLKDDYKNELFRVASGRFGYLYANSRALMYKIPSTEGKLENSLGRFDQLKKGLRKIGEERYFDLYNVKYELRDTIISRTRTIYPKFRDTYLPRAWIVHRVKVLPDSLIIPYMASYDFNPGQEVIFEKSENVKSKSIIANAVEDSVIITDYGKESIELRATAGADGYLVLSEHFYPGWKAYVDRKEVSIYRANYLFRAISLSAGEHEIKFEFTPKSFKLGIVLSILGVLFIIGSWISSKFFTSKTKKESST